MSNPPSTTQRSALQDVSDRVNASPARTMASNEKSDFQKYLEMANGKKRFDPVKHSALEYTRQQEQQAAAANINASRPSTILAIQTAQSRASKIAGPKLPTNTKTPASSGKKRKAEAPLDEDIAAYKQNLNDQIDPDSFEDMTPPNCASVRNRINNLMDSGIMTKKDFCDAIGSSPNNVNSFLKKTGQMGGSGSNVWYNAWAWFKQREVAGIKFPDVKKRQKLEAEAAAFAGTSSGSGSSSNMTTPKSAVGLAKIPDIYRIHLYGEESDEVAVWDTCDEVRRKINARLKTPGLTQAQFCRDIYAQLKAPKCKGIQSKQLADFRSLRGARAGAKSSVYYAAYVYFEKLRLAEAKPKTKHRQEMEAIYPGGFDIENDHRTQYIVKAGSNPSIDQYGRIFSF